MAGQLTKINGFTGTTGYMVAGATQISVEYTCTVNGTINRYRCVNPSVVVYQIDTSVGGNTNIPTASPTTRFYLGGTAPFPTAGNSVTIVLQESTNSGTSFATVGTNGTLTAITVPVVNTTQTFSTATTTTISHTIDVTTSGVGGTIQYATSSSATYNTGIINTWQASPTFTLTRGTTYYLWARRADGAAFASSSGAQLVPDMTPDTYTNLAANTTGLGHNNYYYASFAATAPVLGGLGGGTIVGYTVANLGSGVSTTASITLGNADFALGSVFGTYGTTATVTNGSVIYCRFLTPNTINTPETYTLQIGTQARSVTLTTGAVLPDRLVNVTITPYVSILPFALTSATVSISGGTSGHEYTVATGSGFATNVSTPVAADGSGNATVTIVNANLPTGAGVWLNNVHARVPVAAGGNNVWSPVGTGSENGGASGSLTWNWSRATAATTLTVGTVTQGATELTGGATSNVSIGWTPYATSPGSHGYQIVRTDLAADIVVVAETSTTPQSLLNADANDLPLEGVVAGYKFQVRRTAANGGDDIWYDATGTNNPFSIQRIKEPTVNNTQNYDVTTISSTITHPIDLKLDGLGGTLQFAVTTNTTYPSTGWVAEASNSWTLVRGNTYYFWARRSTDLADYDVIDSAQVIPPYSSYGLRIFSTNGAKTVFDTSSLPMNLITCKLVSGTEILSQTLTAGATGAAVYVDGLTTTNGGSIFVVVRAPTSLNTTPPYTLSRQAGYFTLTNNLTSTATLYFFAGRYK